MTRLKGGAFTHLKSPPLVDVSKGGPPGPCYFCIAGIKHDHNSPVTAEQQQELDDYLRDFDAKRL